MSNIDSELTRKLQNRRSVVDSEGTQWVASEDQVKAKQQAAVAATRAKAYCRPSEGSMSRQASTGSQPEQPPQPSPQAAAKQAARRRHSDFGGDAQAAGWGTRQGGARPGGRGSIDSELAKKLKERRTVVDSEGSEWQHLPEAQRLCRSARGLALEGGDEADDLCNKAAEFLERHGIRSVQRSAGKGSQPERPSQADEEPEDEEDLEEEEDAQSGNVEGSMDSELARKLQTRRGVVDSEGSAWQRLPDCSKPTTPCGLVRTDSDTAIAVGAENRSMRSDLLQRLRTRTSSDNSTVAGQELSGSNDEVRAHPSPRVVDGNGLRSFEGRGSIEVMQVNPQEDIRRASAEGSMDSELVRKLQTRRGVVDAEGSAWQKVPDVKADSRPSQEPGGADPAVVGSDTPKARSFEARVSIECAQEVSPQQDIMRASIEGSIDAELVRKLQTRRGVVDSEGSAWQRVPDKAKTTTPPSTPNARAAFLQRSPNQSPNSPTVERVAHLGKELAGGNDEVQGAIPRSSEASANAEGIQALDNKENIQRPSIEGYIDSELARKLQTRRGVVDSEGSAWQRVPDLPKPVATPSRLERMGSGSAAAGSDNQSTRASFLPRQRLSSASASSAAPGQEPSGHTDEAPRTGNSELLRRLSARRGVVDSEGSAWQSKPEASEAAVPRAAPVEREEARTSKESFKRRVQGLSALLPKEAAHEASASEQGPSIVGGERNDGSASPVAAEQSCSPLAEESLKGRSEGLAASLPGEAAPEASTSDHGASPAGCEHNDGSTFPAAAEEDSSQSAEARPLQTEVPPDGADCPPLPAAAVAAASLAGEPEPPAERGPVAPRLQPAARVIDEVRPWEELWHGEETWACELWIPETVCSGSLGGGAWAGPLIAEPAVLCLAGNGEVACFVAEPRPFSAEEGGEEEKEEDEDEGGEEAEFARMVASFSVTSLLQLSRSAALPDVVGFLFDHSHSGDGRDRSGLDGATQELLEDLAAAVVYVRFESAEDATSCVQAVADCEACHAPVADMPPPELSEAAEPPTPEASGLPLDLPSGNVSNRVSSGEDPPEGWFVNAATLQVSPLMACSPGSEECEKQSRAFLQELDLLAGFV